MKIDAFKVEEWMNEYENYATYNIAETCVDSISMDELFELVGEDKEAFLKEFTARRLTYGAIEGSIPYKKGICGLYRTIRPEHICSTHGAAGANHLVMYSIVEPGDRVISVMPTYQQLYSIPKSFRADVQILPLKKEEGYLPNLDELRKLATPETKLICINNPNNPTGALMSSEMLKEIVEIARSVDAYVLCDEVYRHLNQESEYVDSIADLYEKGISISSMSKVFSLAGIRLGWVATKDAAVMRACLSHRDYSIVSCGMLDEAIASVALEHADILLKRNVELVRKNLAILDQWITEHPGYSYVKPKAGTTALVYYPGELKSRDFCVKLFKETGAFVTPGDCFEQEQCFRIGYASDEQVLRDGLAALEKFQA